MYRNKKDVDKHVENLLSKLSIKEFKTRAYSVARLYFEVGDYVSCQKYVEQYLTQKDNNAAAHKLLGHTLQKLGQKEKALEQFKTSLDIDPSQTSLLLDICELLADDDITIDPGRAKYWCEKAEATYPKHPITFRLRERLVAVSNPDPDAVINLLTGELAMRPKDASLHARLLKHYLHNNKFKEAFDHSCNVEFSNNNLRNNYAWYDAVASILKHNVFNKNDWQYQLLLLTVRERLCVLSLTETSVGVTKNLVECSELLHLYDQAIESVSKAGPQSGSTEFYVGLLQHHKGQLAFHAATFLLKKGKRDQISWRDATKAASPLMLIAWHTAPLDTKVIWMSSAPEKQQHAVRRWYTEGTYRCSQSGHYLLANIQDKNQSFLDRISQSCSGSHWKDKLYEQIFTTREHLMKIKSSHLTSSFESPTLRLPRRVEVEAYDADSQREYPNSLHHYVWILLNYKEAADFKCTVFDILSPKSRNYANCGPETLNKFDIQAFLYCATLTSRQQKFPQTTSTASDKPHVLPANITDLLCSMPQMKWWDCAYKFSQNELGTELTDIRLTLSRGIEVVRCVDNHGLDPELLCTLGRIFSKRARSTTAVEERNNLEARAGLYYSTAIPLLEKLKNRLNIKVSEKRMFEYTHKDLKNKTLNSLIEESKLYVAVNHYNDGDYEKVIELLSEMKSALALYHLSQTYKRMALEEQNSSRDGTFSKPNYGTLMLTAKNYAYKTLDKLKETDVNKNDTLYSDTQELIEDIENHLCKIDSDVSYNNNVDGKHTSDGKFSPEQSVFLKPAHLLRNISSTPKRQTDANVTNYRSAIESQILDSTPLDQQYLGRIENEIQNLQKRDIAINDFMDQTRNWFDENRKLGNKIMSTINANIESTTDQLKLLKVSVDHVKDQIDECRNECKDVGELKKQVAELKKEVSKLKKASSEQTIDESDLYNLDDDYKSTEGTSGFAAQLPFTPPQMIPPFNQRLVPPFSVPPNPYQLYTQGLYNLYNQYSQFTQPSPGPVPGAAPFLDPNRPPVNYPGMFPTPDQMYLDVAHLVPPAQVAPNMPTVPLTTSTANMPAPPVSHLATKPVFNTEPKESARAMPVNVVITSSDPLPTHTTAPAPVLSVTIPPKHIKGTPHDYQIQMPSSNDSKNAPTFSFAAPRSSLSTTSHTVNWSPASIFKNAQTSSPVVSTSSTINTFMFSPKNIDKSNNSGFSVVDGSAFEKSNSSLNKSRTLSEKSNASVDNNDHYDPIPDFKSSIPLPEEVKVTTGEEDEIVLFSSRAKLFRFVEKQWKERGIGEMKLLKHKETGKVRVLMRREQVHKVCANHIITPEMEIKQMKNEAKAYFWVANDFADETVQLEKFCIRFKTAEIAEQFFKAFEKARLESSSIKSPNTSITTMATEKTSKTEKDKSQHAVETGKTVLGGFTFSGAPTFKPVTEQAKVEAKPMEPVASKSNIFGNLTFKTTTSSPFGNLLNLTSAPINSNSNQTSNTSAQLNTSDTVEEFEPNVDFKPVVPLPALVEAKTGEEEESIIFEHRAKLLRFDAASKEWKERGLGNIKLLAHKDNVQKLRLLMRREQVMKVCCNHAVTKDMVFQKMPNMDKAVTWCAKDYSEGELVPETFCLRFKTPETCDEFIEAVKKAQSLMKDGTKAAKEEENAAKQNQNIGFGDKFKPKEGSWHCNSCYTNNLESFLKCACCEQPKPTANQNQTSATPSWGDSFKPKPGSWECNACFVRNDANIESCSACNNPKDPTKSKAENNAASASTPKFNFGIPGQNVIFAEPSKQIQQPITCTASGWGDKFKPKEGTWECKACFIRNESNVDSCTACSSPKDPNTVKKETKTIFVNDSGPKFSFGIPSATSITPTQTSATASASGWGDKFKPKEGTWECKACFVRNESNVENCSACNSPKDPNAAKKENNSIFGNSAESKFSFGVPSIVGNDQKPKTETSNIFGTNKFSFGTPQTQASEQKPATFSFSKPTGDNSSPLNFSVAKKNDSKQNAKPGLLPTPQIPAKDAVTFGTNESGTFKFEFKPKTPPKGKSPLKSPKSEKGEESDDGNEYASEDEGHHIQFKPVIPLPDKVEVVTGEENEEELYGHRAKLFRFVGAEWKERGIGVVKILRHRDTGKLRVVMRREQILKICLNHTLTPEITYSPKDDKSWLFAANDFSEGELTLQSFCLRFKTKEIAHEFKTAIENARAGKATPTEGDKKEQDVVFVNEVLASPEEQKKAKDLMLPENFFTYKTKDPCQGCRGCKDSEDDSPASSARTNKFFSKVLEVTPIKSSPQFQSPTNSMYGTPFNAKSPDTSLFRTPLNMAMSNVNLSSSNDSSYKSGECDSTNKENTFLQRSSIFDTSNTSIESVSNDSKNSTVKGSLLSTPKLGNVISENKSPDPKSLFGSASKSAFGEGKPMFGESKSIFGDTKPVFGDNKTVVGESKSIFGENKPVFGTKSIFGVATESDKEKTEVKSIFGEADQKPVNLFSGTQGSIFGPGALGNNNQTKPSTGIFGSNQKPLFGSNQTSLFGAGQAPDFGSNQTSVFGSNQNSVLGSNQNSLFGSATKSEPSQIFGGNQSVFEKLNFGGNTEQKMPDVTATAVQQDQKPLEKVETKENENAIFKVDNTLTFAALNKENSSGFQKKQDFTWEGTGQQLFTAATKLQDKSKNESGAGDEPEEGTEQEDYDPHYEPIVPLPEKIVVTTGEEDEEKLFGERAKLYRYDENSREWKERGVGEMKILYHPQRKSYRLLLRREQVHKAVLNMLMFMDLELLPMKNSDRAWTWAGRNYAETPSGEQETLAVRFKSVELATAFKNKVTESVRKLQAAAAQAIREQKEEKPATTMRLPKHLEPTSRADNEMTLVREPSHESTNGQGNEGRQEHFEQNAEEADDDENYDEDEYDNEHYYEEEDDESGVYYACAGEAVIREGNNQTSCEDAHVQVIFDQEVYSPKIMVTDANTGEILSDMLIHTETEFQMEGNSCTWSGIDYTTNTDVEKTVTVNFPDSDTAMQFYDSCETSKAATYSSTDPES